MSDIVERLRSPEFADVAAKYLMAEAAAEIERLRFDIEQCRTEAVAMLDKAVMEQSRLRSLLKEVAMALAAVMEDDNVPYDESCANHEWGRSVLSKIKGEA